MGLRVSTELDPKGVQTGAAAVKRSLSDVDAAMSRTEKASKGVSVNMGNIGAQIQDISVQLQGGQNPFLVLSQQVPQMIPLSLGLAGALTGIGFAALGVISGLSSTKDSLKDLEGALESVDNVLTTTADGMFTLSEDTIRLANTNVKLADSYINVARAQAEVAQQQAGNVLAETIQRTIKGTYGLTEALTGAKNPTEQQAKTVYELSKSFYALQQGEQLSEDQTVAFLNTLESLNPQTKEAKQKVLELRGAVANYALTQSKTNDIIRVTSEGYADLERSERNTANASKSRIDVIKLLNQELDVLTTRTTESARAAAILEAQQKAGVTADSERGQTIADLAGKIFDQKEQVKALAQQERDRQRILTEQQAQEERALELAGRTNQSYEDQRAALQRLSDQGRLTQEEFARGLLAIGERQGSLTFAQGYIQQLDLMQEASNSSFQEIGQQVATVFGSGGTLQQGIADATAKAIVFGDDFGDTMKQLGLTIASELLSQLILVGIQQATNAAVGATTSQALIASTTASAVASQATLTATTVAAGTASAAAWAPAAALASLATLGTNAAPAIAGITAVTTASQVAALPKIGFATGGYVDGGGTGTSDSINARLSRGEFVVRESVTRRNRGALESLNSTGQMPTGAVNVYVENYSNANVTASKDSNGDVRLVVKEEIRKQLPDAVAREMGNPGSKSRTALARTSNVKRN